MKTYTCHILLICIRDGHRMIWIKEVKEQSVYIHLWIKRERSNYELISRESFVSLHEFPLSPAHIFFFFFMQIMSCRRWTWLEFAKSYMQNCLESPLTILVSKEWLLPRILVSGLEWKKEVAGRDLSSGSFQWVSSWDTYTSQVSLLFKLRSSWEANLWLLNPQIFNIWPLIFSGETFSSSFLLQNKKRKREEPRK